MTYYELLVSLRQRLITAYDKQDRDSADDLFTTLSMLREVAYETNDEALISLIIDFVDVARDIVMGVKGKSEIPTMETIRAIFPSSQKAS